MKPSSVYIANPQKNFLRFILIYCDSLHWKLRCLMTICRRGKHPGTLNFMSSLYLISIQFPHERQCYSTLWCHCWSFSICCPPGKFLIFLQNSVHFLLRVIDVLANCISIPPLWSLCAAIRTWGSTSSLVCLGILTHQRWVVGLSLHCCNFANSHFIWIIWTELYN